MVNNMIPIRVPDSSGPSSPKMARDCGVTSTGLPRQYLRGSSLHAIALAESRALLFVWVSDNICWSLLSSCRSVNSCASFVLLVGLTSLASLTLCLEKTHRHVSVQKFVCRYLNVNTKLNVVSSSVLNTFCFSVYR
jgi:hypothetical protein